MIRLLCFFLILVPLASRAQFNYTLDQSIPVQNLKGENLLLAWAGGLNAAQFNTMDLNGDGVEDLVLYDRMANKVITFLAADTYYVAAPEYESLFPDGIYNWLLLRDYNCDGKKDVFTGDVLGMKVYRNVTTSPGHLEWEQHLFDTGFPDSKSTVLLTRNPSTNIKVNLQLQYDDLPAIGDIDGDGDLDIMNIRYAGHTVELHQNLSQENNTPCDSMDFVRVTRSWGDFQECTCGTFAFKGTECPPNSGGRTKHAGGKSLLMLDVNHDQQLDLIFSEAECTQLFALQNKGTASAPIIDNGVAFPQTQPVNFVLFPAAFYEDVDFDGKKDLIATPNIFSKEFLNSNLAQSTWFYKNTGSNASPTFSYVQSNFLQENMIDVGDNAVPAFSDYDGDGDFDMLVSAHSSDTYTSRIYLFENTGSPTSPSFRLVADDYLEFSNSRFYNLKIQLVDINGDNTQDLVFTATSFDNNLTNLYYIANKSQSSLDFSGSTIRIVSFPMTSSENLSVIDIDSDGLPDVLAGRSEGNLEYWKNTGIAGSPVFQMAEENYLGFTSSPLRQNPTVAISDLDADGTVDLLIGDQAGYPGIIRDFRNSEGEAALEKDLVFNPVLQEYRSKNLGGKLWPVVVNLFNTRTPAVVVGNGLGGIHILRSEHDNPLPEKPELSIYPNPVVKSEVLNVRADRQGTLEIISVLGQQLSKPIMLKGNEVYRYTLPPLAAGLYLVKFTAFKKSTVERLVIQ